MLFCYVEISVFTERGGAQLEIIWDLLTKIHTFCDISFGFTVHTYSHINIRYLKTL